MQQHPGDENRFAVEQSSGGDGNVGFEEALADGGPHRPLPAVVVEVEAEPAHPERTPKSLAP